MVVVRCVRAGGRRISLLLNLKSDGTVTHLLSISVGGEGERGVREGERERGRERERINPSSKISALN